MAAVDGAEEGGVAPTARFAAGAPEKRESKGEASGAGEISGGAAVG